MPRSERNGRVHSSTVTVAVLDAGNAADGLYDRRRPDDFQVDWYSGSGAGGQFRNKHQNSARITHLPTGIVKQAQTRSRENSFRAAMTALHTDLDRLRDQASGQATNAVRQAHVGSGERSDKRRTYQFTNDIATDHVTGKKAALSKVFSGHFDLLW